MNHSVDHTISLIAFSQAVAIKSIHQIFTFHNTSVTNSPLFNTVQSLVPYGLIVIMIFSPLTVFDITGFTILS